MDSTITVQVGAKQLQKIIKTMRHYREIAELASKRCDNLEIELLNAQEEISNLEDVTFRMQKIGEINIDD